MSEDLLRVNARTIMSEAKCEESRVLDGEAEEESEDDDAAVEDKLSIEQILEGMTNEFNRKPTSPTETQKLSEADKIRTKVDEKNDRSDVYISDEVELVRECAFEEKEDSKKEEEPEKKDGSIPRIVLTFRTIDENTDDGKKTKISSCSSNLTLVPDELVKCDRIGGVSVKIETSDEISDKSEEELAMQNNGAEKVNETVTIEENNLQNELMESKEKNTEEVQSNLPLVDLSDDDTSGAKRKRKVHLRAHSESTEESPGLKRSARRLSRDSIKSTVLERAMAQKEKSNYTEENLQFKKHKKYSRPGRPKKINLDKMEFKRDDQYSNNLKINASLDSSRNTSLSENDSTDTSLSDCQKSSNSFDGMPTLSLIVKTSDAQAKLVNSVNNSLSPEIPPDLEKPFLKPVMAKVKRERGRPRGSFTSRKLGEAIEDGSFINSDGGKSDDLSDDNCIPAKRTRRSAAPSPSPAEGQASKPESTAIKSDTYQDSMICLCQIRSQLYVTITGSGAPLYCTAVDSIDNKLIGCCNEVDSSDVAMRRPSARIPYIILCRMHKERILRHNCCPTCGTFCSQGRFVQCINGHLYHHGCEIHQSKKLLCPHCNAESLKFEVIVTMTGKRRPIYIPTRRQFSKFPSAKMGFPGKADNTKLAGKSASPLIRPDEIKVPKPTPNSRPERYTILSLYTCVKNGDLEKLVNVLACGFNPNHTYRDCANRTSLHISAEKGHLACVHVLAQAGAQLDVLDKNQYTPLMLAAIQGKVNVVRYLMRIGADAVLKGEDGMTALHMAAKAGRIEVCKIILSECKTPRTLIDSTDDGGWTSLIWACEFSHVNVARYLIDKKCDPLIRDAEQNIALHWSAFSGSSEITEMLLNEGCDINAVNVHGDTPLHIAARQNQYAVTVLLLARGAKISEINSAGDSAINCCTVEGDTLTALQLNAKVNEMNDNMWEKTTKILTNDISRGKEANPIQCVNSYDAEDKPTDFVYVTENCFTSTINVDRTITSLQSCRCENNCSSERCLCGNISLRCWYDDEGILIPEFNYADPPMLFECNPACDCNRITCNNRVVQHGVTQRFQLFRTNGKGWGIRTLRNMRKGTYVCEYVGEIISDSEADHREDDSYLFDLDNRDGETYCIDARRYGNMARFINHSCAPNLLPVRVFIEHQDLHFPRIAFFANRDIEADEELGFDYGEKFWIIKYKSFTCTCGAENCRYSEKTIQVTLDAYRRRIQQEEMFAAQTV